MCEILDHQIAIEDNVVKLWTTKYVRLPIQLGDIKDEKKLKAAKCENCWRQKVKSELFEKLGQLRHDKSMILRGTYKSKVPRKSKPPDMENVLFYSIL
ncbi:MAG: hypothetical protein J7L19_00170 [Dehalococcoidia bacterium]|nr:hypothetical protein [Dehalococcoidia bacterium]